MAKYLPLETGDVVAVLTANGDFAYFGEVSSLPRPDSDEALFDRAHIGIYNPETDEVHYVPVAAGIIRRATEEESDAYVARWVDEE